MGRGREWNLHKLLHGPWYLSRPVYLDSLARLLPQREQHSSARGSGWREARSEHSTPSRCARQRSAEGCAAGWPRRNAVSAFLAGGDSIRLVGKDAQSHGLSTSMLQGRGLIPAGGQEGLRVLCHPLLFIYSLHYRSPSRGPGPMVQARYLLDVSQ